MTINNTFNRALGLLILGGAAAFNGTLQAAPQTMMVAGGCFWCVESDFELVQGVSDVVSGYTGGHTENPTYKQVSAGNTGHFEAVMIHFDDDIVSLKALADYYWKTIDPTDAEGQFCDKGALTKPRCFIRTTNKKRFLKRLLPTSKPPNLSRATL